MRNVAKNSEEHGIRGIESVADAGFHLIEDRELVEAVCNDWALVDFDMFDMDMVRAA